MSGRKRDDGSVRAVVTCGVCGDPISSARRGLIPPYCREHLSEGEDWKRVRLGMGELAAELDHLKRGGVPDSGSLFMRDLLALVADSDAEPVGVQLMAKTLEAPATVVIKVLEAAQVRVYVRDGNSRERSVKLIDKDEAREACSRLAAEAIKSRQDEVARKKSQWTYLTKDEFDEVVVKVGSKPKLADALGCGVSSLYGWANGKAAPPTSVQQRLRRLRDGATLSEVADAQAPQPPTPLAKAAAFRHKPHADPTALAEEPDPTEGPGVEAPADDAREAAVEALRDSGRHARVAVGATFRAAAKFLGRMAAKIEA